MAYKILTPNKSFNGMRNGVVFKEGIGMAPSKRVAKELVNNWGYRCKALEKEKEQGDK